ncbi:MAG TPA: gamma-glutamyl-gamma-aminobutyrate hydrolase family protein [Bacillota bacterium]|jgi:putative glutamine amidotransferase
MRPIIGLTSQLIFREVDCNSLSTEYTGAVEAAGGVPLILPALDSPDLVETIIEAVDGLLLTGGPDIDPAHWGAEPHPKLGPVSPNRDVTDLTAYRAARRKGLPVFGICRGIQTINVAAGGTLVQDIPSEVATTINHNATDGPRWAAAHRVRVEAQSRLAVILGSTDLGVNSFHHQAIMATAPGFRVTARAEDGVIEGIEATDGDFVVAVQWHPERMWFKDPISLRLFRALVEAAGGGGAR